MARRERRGRACQDEDGEQGDEQQEREEGSEEARRWSIKSASLQEQATGQNAAHEKAKMREAEAKGAARAARPEAKARQQRGPRFARECEGEQLNLKSDTWPT